MRSWATLAVGVLIGQWLTFTGLTSPAELYVDGRVAWERHDFTRALLYWSRAVTVQPDNALFHYLRGTALERLGQRQAAAEAYRLTLLLDPSARLARLAEAGLAGVEEAAPSASPPTELRVAIQPERGVWVAAVVVNGARPARFLVDTGSSVTLLSPALAAAAGVRPATAPETIELQTLAGRAVAPIATVASLRIGGRELRDVPVVVHDPGAGVDGILGNTVLARYRLTLDAGRRLLRLAPPD